VKLVIIKSRKEADRKYGWLIQFDLFNIQ